MVRAFAETSEVESPRQAKVSDLCCNITQGSIQLFSGGNTSAR